MQLRRPNTDQPRLTRAMPADQSLHFHRQLFKAQWLRQRTQPLLRQWPILLTGDQPLDIIVDTFFKIPPPVTMILDHLLQQPENDTASLILPLDAADKGGQKGEF